jgi:hypothetical protein
MVGLDPTISENSLRVMSFSGRSEAAPENDAQRSLGAAS